MKRKPSRQWHEGLEVLGPELESCLVRWHGFGGREPSLRTRQDWAEAWAAWGDVVLPKWLEVFPATRPAAMYAAGLLPRRPVLVALPAAHEFTAVYVGERDGSVGVWHVDAGEPHQRPEAAFLLEHGVIDGDEYRRRGRADVSRWWEVYPFELAEYV